ncbi:MULTISPECIES: hypothetical protein [unclassified Algoriphagus]|jgi:hypothetical protein|uniref:hypothetical protein n=1 Tax=unclassified Algoriphagus TaxID=2641541 RepID=UPI000ED1385C|nr:MULTISPECIES: hypothetical protein [unclassified Algoriphagus]HCX75234.1 hypothetical protein [Algoriphagus sp.]|tara:strand:+ start:3563 stop:4108 length:546 start_codon:yes stop_codon:yes gene_type:complete
MKLILWKGVVVKKVKQLLWDNIISILALAGFIILISTILFPCILPEGKEFEAIIGVLIFFFGVLYNVLTYKISADKFSKELFNEFNKRFDEINEELNNILSGKFTSFSGSNRTEYDVIIDYLNLCSEECYWFKKGRIDIKVWNSWKKGMLHYLKHENFIDVVDKQREEEDSYYGLYKELNL